MPDTSSVQYERKDVEGNGVLGFGIGLALALVLTLVGTWYMLRFMTVAEDTDPGQRNPWAKENHNAGQRDDHAPPSTTKIDRGTRSRLSGIPKLEMLDLQDPTQDTGRHREITVQEQMAEQDAYLKSFGVLGKGKDELVHIPIDMAMTKILTQLKMDPGTAPDEFYKAPGRSSSGQAPKRDTP